MTPFSGEKLQLHCSRIHWSKFQDKDLFVYLLLAERFFSAYGQQLNVFRFRIKSAEWAGNFVVCSLEVSLRIISFRQPFGLRVWNFSRPRVNHRCLWASIRQQPCAFKPISIWHMNWPEFHSITSSRHYYFNSGVAERRIWLKAIR